MAVKPVIVGIDGSADSVRALTWADEHARQVGAPLVALVAWQLDPSFGYTAMAEWDTSDRVEQDAQQMLTTTVHKALGEDADVEMRTVRGPAAAVLVDASQDAQLVVVGTRGHGGFAGLLLGSVSRYVISHAHCPVLVIPHVPTPKK